MHVIVQCGRPVGQRVLKIQRDVFLLPTFVFRGYYSLRGRTEVSFRTLNLLVVGKIGFGLINRDDGVLLALIRMIVKNLDTAAVLKIRRREASPRSIDQGIRRNRSALSRHLAMLERIEL
jgi:hypothetical protein